MSATVRRAALIFLAMVAALAVVIGALIVGSHLGDDKDEPAAATDLGTTGDAGPSYVEPEACREEGAALLEDADAALTAQTADELARYATIVQGDHFPSCAGSPVNALAHVVDAVARVSQEAEICRVSGQWMDYDGDGQQEDLTGFECDSVNRAFSKVNVAIDDARTVLDAKS